MKKLFSSGLYALLIFPLSAQADQLQTGDTAWILIASALVLFMILPGLSLFYAGLVRSKNVLSILIQCFAVCCTASILWMVIGYSLTFTEGGLNPLIGGFKKLFLSGVDRSSMSGSIPESIFIMFQLTFAAITPALIVGGFAERMRFAAILAFTVLWSLVVYYPIAHQVWGGGWLSDIGILDFAGGMVVHTTAGTAALVAALMIGPRHQFPQEPMPPNNMTMTVTGAGILWVGWFGFNGGSALAANGDAAMAVLVTQIAAATAALSWMFLEWLQRGKPSVLGIVTGTVAGLVAITPACGFVSPTGALCIGILATLSSYSALYLLKHVLKIDDSLDVFPVHGISGAVGSILTGIFASAAFGGVGIETSVGTQLLVQLTGTIYVFLYTAIATYICLKLVGLFTPLRMDREQEIEGLDLIQHGESGYKI